MGEPLPFLDWHVFLTGSSNHRRRSDVSTIKCVNGNMDDIIYLDHAATTRPDTRVLEAMMPFLSAEYGNPSSVHRLGRKARLVVEESREFIAELIGAEPSEIVFTSGGTEANNLALRGASGHGRIITSSAEHEAVLRSAEAIEHMGRDVTLLDPENDGAVSVSKLREAM